MIKSLKVSKTELLGFVMASVIVSGVGAAAVSFAAPAHVQTSHICSYAKFASN